MRTSFHMTDVGNKDVTERTAAATGEIALSEKVIEAVLEKRLPKGDVLALAEVAGINAMKRTSDILPLCHPLNIDAADVQLTVERSVRRIRVVCTVRTHGRTGVEMEALCGVSAALLCIYDLTKGLDKGAVISGIQLDYKAGGKSGIWRRSESAPIDEANEHIDEANEHTKSIAGVRCAVLTVSDRCFNGTATDISGGLIARYLTDGGAEVVRTELLPDEADQIRSCIEYFSREERLDLVLVTGGTGLGPRDVTPDAIMSLWSKTLPGFGETFRSRGGFSTPRAWLSRAEAGLVENTLVVLLPGSPSGVKDGLSILDETLSHMLGMIRGESH